jgi:hypothetical protein
MLGFVQPIIRTIFEIIILIPMPWCAGLVLLIIGIIFRLSWRFLIWLVIKLAYLLFLLVDIVASVLLLPEYFINNILRKHGHKPIIGTYTLDSILQKIVGIVYGWTSKVDDIREKGYIRILWIVIIACVPIVLWYVRFYLEDTFAGNYIDYGIAWWNSVVNWARTGLWTPPIRY